MLLLQIEVAYFATAISYACKMFMKPGNIKGGSITGFVCFANKNKNCQLSYSLFQTSQTGGQWFSDISPLVFPDETYTNMLAYCPTVQVKQHKVLKH